MAQDYLDQLAEFVADMRFEDLPPDTIAAARDVVLDTLGAITAGSRLDENANFARLAAEMNGPGKAGIIGHPYRVQPVWATFVNATAGVALEMDEGNRVGGGHPSIHVTPGALAVGEDLGSSGRDVLTAIILGYEVISRVGTATQVKAEVHSHGTWGTIGTAAVTAINGNQRQSFGGPGRSPRNLPWQEGPAPPRWHAATRPPSGSAPHGRGSHVGLH